MKEINKKIKYIMSGVCIGTLILFMVSIGLRIFTRQILVKKMEMDNAFTQAVFFDKPRLDEYTVETAVQWDRYYPFDGEGEEAVHQTFSLNKYIEKVAMLEDKINAYTSALLMGQELISEGHYMYNNLLNWKYGAHGADPNSNIIYMKNGYLTYQQPQVEEKDIQEIADSVKNFSDYLEEKNIPFLYVNAGSKVNPEDKEMSEYDKSLEYTNENGDELQAALDSRGVAYLDMREELLESGTDWYESYYKTDHHWTTETGLWAAGVVADKLNEMAGMEFDSKYFEQESYELTCYKNAMFGGQGETVTHINAESEDFITIFPKFDTDFSVEIPTQSYKAQGDYKMALYDLELLGTRIEQKNGYMYTTTRWNNDALGIVKNNKSPDNKDKKILVLQDSFSFYLTTYLACDVGEIHMMHPMAFDGSIRKYIESEKPDAVVIIYGERNIQRIDWETHTSAFDFR